MTFTLPLSAKPSANSTLCTRCNLWKLDCEEIDADHNICELCMPDTCQTCYEGDASVECSDGEYICTDCQTGNGDAMVDDAKYGGR